MINSSKFLSMKSHQEVYKSMRKLKVDPNELKVALSLKKKWTSSFSTKRKLIKGEGCLG